MTSYYLTGSGDDVGAGAVLVPDFAAHSALDAVGHGGRRHDGQLRGDDRRVIRLQQRDRHARITGGVGGTRVVGVVGLDSRDRGANVGLGGRVVRTIAEAQVRGDRDREQDAEDDDDNEKFDEGETAFLTGQPLPDLAGHYGSSFHGERTMWPDRHRPTHPRWVTLDRVDADSWKPNRKAKGAV